MNHSMACMEPLFLGMDGGGTGCRVRLVDAKGRVLGTGTGGAANIRLGHDVAWSAIMAASDTALGMAGLDRGALPQLHVGMGVAGIMRPSDIERLRAAGPRFAGLEIATDAHTACLGAFAGEDGGIVISGTGSVGYALIRGEAHSIGGWTFQVSDQGSGADIGREVVRAALLGYDGLGPASDFTERIMTRLGGRPAEVVAWSDTAQPRDYAEFARDTLDFAGRGDPIANAILNRAAGQIANMIRRLHELGAAEICLMGGLAAALEARLPEEARAGLTAPLGDALDGAIRMARQAATTA
jgi:glucosamine kinase